MQDLKRKSDKADVEPDSRRRSPSDRDVTRPGMMDLTQSGGGGGIVGGKEWLMSEIKLMEDHYKNACERRAKIMRFHSDVLERNMHHIYPRAPGFMVLGYQSACQEWDRRRRNVAAYTSRVAEVYVEPLQPSSPDKMDVKVEPGSNMKDVGAAGLSKDPAKVGSTPGHATNSNANSNSGPGQTTVHSTTNSAVPPNSAEQGSKGLLPSVEIIPQTQKRAQSVSQPTYNPPDSNLNPNLRGNDNADANGRAMDIDIDLGMGSSDLHTLDPGEMALFDFINSVANSPTAFDTVAPSTAGGVTNAEVNTNSNTGMGEGLDPGLAGMSGSGQGTGAVAGLDFGLLEAGLQTEIARSGQDAPEVDTKDGPSGTKGGDDLAQPGLPGGSLSEPKVEQPAPQAGEDSNGANVDPLDLFSQYPDLFNFRGPQDYTSSLDGNNDHNNNNNVNGSNADADAANGNANGVFDPDSFDYSMLDPNAFFADGMQGMDGM